MRHYEPSSEDEAAEIVRESGVRAERLRLVGGGTKAGIGRPAQDEATLYARALSGITLYEPARSVSTSASGVPARAATTISAGS